MLQSVSTKLRIAVVAACVALVAPPLMAQDASGPPPGPPPDSGHHMHRGPRDPGAMLLKGITLTSDQQSQIKAIHERYHASMDSARQSGNKDWSGMRKMMEAQASDVRAVLTSDQQKVFDENVNEMKQRREQMRQQHSGQGSN